MGRITVAVTALRILGWGRADECFKNDSVNQKTISAPIAGPVTVQLHTHMPLFASVRLHAPAVAAFFRIDEAMR